MFLIGVREEGGEGKGAQIRPEQGVAGFASEAAAMKVHVSKGNLEIWFPANAELLPSLCTNNNDRTLHKEACKLGEPDMLRKRCGKFSGSMVRLEDPVGFIPKKDGGGAPQFGGRPRR